MHTSTQESREYDTVMLMENSSSRQRYICRVSNKLLFTSLCVYSKKIDRMLKLNIKLKLTRVRSVNNNPVLIGPSLYKYYIFLFNSIQIQYKYFK